MPTLASSRVTSTLAALERSARRRPDAPALRCADETFSYAELLDAVRSSAAKLSARRVRRLGLLADNSPGWIVTDLAAQLADVVLVPLPAFFSPKQLRHAILDSGVDALALDAGAADLAASFAAETLGDLASRLVFYRPVSAQSQRRLPDGTAKISYTSGTTGEPKGVCLSQPGMDRVAASLCEATETLNLRRHLCLLPLATLLENVAGVFAPLQNGGEVVVPRLAEIGWGGSTMLDARRLLQCISEFEPDSVILVPQMLQALVHALEHGARVAESLNFVAVGGGHVAAAVIDRAVALGLPVFEGYGLTEAASVVALNSPERRRRHSVGRPLAHSDVRIDTNGEICVSGASFCGYVGGETTGGAELRTGDIGRLDDDGFLYILGRRKNVFITSYGRNVSPEWVEAEFAKQPSIAQVSIFGEARPWNVGVIVPAPDASRSEIEADLDSVNQTLPDYARLGAWVIAQEPFSPANGLLTANGRNRRTGIWQRYRGQIDACYESYLSQPA